MRWNVTVAGLAASWGFIAILVSAVDLDATVLVFYRLLLAAITIGGDRGRRTSHRLAPTRIGVAGTRSLGLVLATHWTLFFLTIKLSSVAVAVVTVYTAPLFIAVAAPFVLPETRSRVAVAALVPATAGVVLIALAGEDGGHVRPSPSSPGSAPQPRMPYS